MARQNGKTMAREVRAPEKGTARHPYGQALVGEKGARTAGRSPPITLAGRRFGAGGSRHPPVNSTGRRSVPLLRFQGRPGRGRRLAASDRRLCRPAREAVTEPATAPLRPISWGAAGGDEFVDPGVDLGAEEFETALVFLAQPLTQGRHCTLDQCGHACQQGRLIRLIRAGCLIVCSRRAFAGTGDGRSRQRNLVRPPNPDVSASAKPAPADHPTLRAGAAAVSCHHGMAATGTDVGPEFVAPTHRCLSIDNPDTQRC
jgi:hypothetical protein